MGFVEMVGAYCVGWLLCNVFLFQVVNRLRRDTPEHERQRQMLAKAIADDLRNNKIDRQIWDQVVDAVNAERERCCQAAGQDER